MRLLHTSDIHLGQTLFGLKRDQTFAKFLDWLTDFIDQHHVDVLVIAGDIFDSATPSHSAQQQYFRFLSRLVASKQCRHAVIVAGNHDSATLINAPHDILETLDIHVVGAASENPADEVVVLKNADGQPEALVLAVPYLRERDVRISEENQSINDKERAIVEGTRRHYAKALEKALEIRKTFSNPDIPILATGHLFAADSSPAQDQCERSLYVGSLGLIPADVFDEQIDYVALGHLHRAQMLKKDPTRRYSGSPIALDFSENNQKKIVLMADFENRQCTVTPVDVPAFDRLERVTGSKEDILPRLGELARLHEPMFCEVVHTQGEFAPQLAQQCRDVLEGSPVELVRVINRAMLEATITSSDDIADVQTLTPEQMFSVRLAKDDSFSEETKKALTLAYEEILQSILHPAADAPQSRE